MRIAFLLPSLACTGPNIVAHDLCTEFVRMGYECKVLYFNEILGLEFPCPTERITFREKINFDGFDIIHSHTFLCDLYLLYHRWSIPAGVPLITTLHQPVSVAKLKYSFGLCKAGVLSVLWNMSLRVFNRIVVLNKDTQNELPKSLSGKTEIIFNGRGPFDIHSKPAEEVELKVREFKSKYKIIGTVSSVDYRKNIEQVVNSLPALEDFGLIVVGTGPSVESLKNLASELGVSDRVMFLGFQKQPGWIFKFFDVFAMCSRSEGFPLAFIESASYGVPAVLSDIPIFKAIVNPDTVKFCELDNPQSFVSAVKEIESSHKQFSDAIHDFYKDNLTAEIMAKNYLKLYSEEKEKLQKQ